MSNDRHNDEVTRLKVASIVRDALAQSGPDLDDPSVKGNHNIVVTGGMTVHVYGESLGAWGRLIQWIGHRSGRRND